MALAEDGETRLITILSRLAVQDAQRESLSTEIHIIA